MVKVFCRRADFWISIFLSTVSILVFAALKPFVQHQNHVFYFLIDERLLRCHDNNLVTAALF